MPLFLTHAQQHSCAPPAHRPALRSGLGSWGIKAVSVLAMFIPVDVLAQGCAMCKTALSGSDDPLAQGIFYSAMLMMSMPFVLFVSIGGWIFYTYRRANHSPHPPASVIPFETTHTKQTQQKEDLP